MPDKPTNPFGVFVFRKDGKIHPRFETLSKTKSEQEFRVGKLFIELGSHLFESPPTIQVLDERDHDFAIAIGGRRIIEVQCIEIVHRDFLAENESRSSESVLLDGKICPVDVEKRDDILIRKIEHKSSKHYGKTDGVSLWLLIWSVTGYMGFYEGWHQGRRHIPKCVENARYFIEKRKPLSFDRIFSFNLLTTPTEL